MGIDIGFGDVKAVFARFIGNGRFETEQIKFPSAIARVKNKAIAGLDDAQIEYEFEKRKYLIGKEALSSANIIPTRDIDFILEFSPLFIFRAMEFVSKKHHLSMDSLCNQTEICLGLPLAYYNSKKRLLAQRLANFEVMGCKVIPQRLAIQAQSQGILLDFLLDDQCKPNRKWLGNDLLILDIGFNTIDILCVNEGRSSSEWSNMLEGAGICRICKDLEIELRKMGIDLPEQAVKNALATRMISIYGKEFNLSESITLMTKDYADFIYREIRSRLSDVLKNSKKLIIAGGGAYYVSEFFKQRFPGDFLHIPNDPEFSNARGYYKYLKGVKNG
jgi:plasmid segregation protein ParM